MSTRGLETERPQQVSCPRCSAPVETGQEYCVDCGLRLPQEQLRGLERATVKLGGRYPWSAGWVGPALLGLIVTIAGMGAAISISDASAPRATPSIATGGGLTATESQDRLTAPEPVVATPAPDPRPTRAPVPRAITWPPDRRGWTIVLLSLPQKNGRAAAAERAEQARRGGLKRVGILNSSRFASLHPGYYVVFQGVFDSEAEATSALQRARGVFRPAYAREIVP